MKVKGHLQVEGNVNADNVPGAGTVTFTDGTNSHSSDTLNFSDDEFYLSTNLTGQPVVNRTTGYPHAVLYKTSNQSIEGGANRILTWDVIAKNVGGWGVSSWNIDLGADNTIITIPAGVRLVKIIAQGRWDGDTGGAGRLNITIQKNGGSPGPPAPNATIIKPASDDVVSDIQVQSFPVDVVEGDTIRIAAFQDVQASPGTIDIVGTASGITWFSVEKLA